LAAFPPPFDFHPGNATSLLHAAGIQEAVRGRRTTSAFFTMAVFQFRLTPSYAYHTWENK
jgi:hypothetical protein